MVVTDEGLRRAVVRLKQSAHAPIRVTDVVELKDAARHLIKLLESK
jgi:hypothetical protein